MHQHAIPQTLLYRQKRAEEAVTTQQEKITPLKLFSRCKHDISELIQHICEIIYKTRRDDLLPCGDTGQCYLSRVVKLLTIFADFDDLLVW